MMIARRALVPLTVVLALGSLAGNCVDGATPDCSDAACGSPSSDASDDTSQTLPEASPDTSTNDSGKADADADASDAGDAG